MWLNLCVWVCVRVFVCVFVRVCVGRRTLPVDPQEDADDCGSCQELCFR